jgi:hypothetical protein
MNRIGSIILTVVLVPSISSAQRDLPNGPIRIVVPRNIDMGTCKFQYLLFGPFGAYGGSVQSRSDVSEYRLETAHEGSAVESLRAFVACPGYQVEAIVLDSLAPSESRRLALSLKPLPSVRFAGVIRGFATPEIQHRFVDVDYTPSWICGFFELIDCLLGRWTLATVPIESDSTFTAALPDLLRDPIIGSFRTQSDFGELSFRIRDQRTGNPIFTLKPAASAQPRGGLQLQTSYSIEQAFDLEPSQ